MKDTARAAAKFGVEIVNGFTGSEDLARAGHVPACPPEMIEAGYQDFADRWIPILDVFDEVGVKFAPGGPSHRDRLRLLDDQAGAGGDRLPRGVRLQLRSQPPLLQFVDPVAFIYEFADRIFHVHVKDSRARARRAQQHPLSHLDFGDHRRGWDFVSPGRGDVQLEPVIPRAQPHRLRRPALDRVGGQRHGPRVRARRRRWRMIRRQDLSPRRASPSTPHSGPAELDRRLR